MRRTWNHLKSHWAEYGVVGLVAHGLLHVVFPAHLILDIVTFLVVAFWVGKNHKCAAGGEDEDTR